jgi:hypothetical protein
MTFGKQSQPGARVETGAFEPLQYASKMFCCFGHPLVLAALLLRRKVAIASRLRAKKRQPTFGGFWAPGRSPHPAGDGRLRYLEAKHEEFADARCTPSWILRDHLEDQVANLLGDSPAAADSFSHFAEHGPIQFEPRLVPPHHCLWEDEKERLFPVGPETACHDPEEFVEWTQSGLGCLRFKRASCWRRARFSSIRLRWVRKMRRRLRTRAQRGRTWWKSYSRSDFDLADFKGGRNYDEGRSLIITGWDLHRKHKPGAG